MKYPFTSLLLSIALLSAVVSNCFAEDDIVVVVSAENPIESMSKSQVIDLYMGKYVAFPNGKKAVPIDLSGRDELKKAFYRMLVDLPLARVNSYWSRIKFSGGARPPVEITGLKEVISYLKSMPNGIAYIPRSHVTSDTKVVFSFDE